MNQYQQFKRRTVFTITSSGPTDSKKFQRLILTFNITNYTKRAAVICMPTHRLLRAHLAYAAAATAAARDAYTSKTTYQTEAVQRRAVRYVILDY